MGKRKSNGSSPTKSSKHEKMLQPKVYIADTYNFKSLVQQLTGNGKYPAPESFPAAGLEAPLVESVSCGSVGASPELEIYKGLEAMLMEMDSDSSHNFDIASNCHQQDHQHQAASLYEYHYDFSGII
ncbi:hypothetical protein SASPL_114159 [Salvia splendens]|uniref:VQ domain-containing protein n=1 Tax=Salvia splendens TaxID=180675 RepID=A0A8X8Y060_SALSN|nr:hypothetical protein SASPL_114159 [Salvia splendens]